MFSSFLTRCYSTVRKCYLYTNRIIYNIKERFDVAFFNDLSYRKVAIFKSRFCKISLLLNE